MLRMNTVVQDYAIAPIRFLGLRTGYRRLAQFVMLLSDASMVAAAFGLAYWLRFYGGITIAPDTPLDHHKYLLLIMGLIPVWLLLFWVMHLYDYHYLLGGVSEYTHALNAITIGMMLVIVMSFLLPDIQIARGWLVMSWLFASVFVCSARFILRRVAYYLRRHDCFVAPAIVIGANQEAQALAAELRNSQSTGLQLVGLIDVDSAAGEHPAVIGGLPVLGNLQALPDLVHKYGIQEAVLATTALTRSQRIEVLEHLVDLPEVEMRLSSGLYEVFTTGMHVTTRGVVPLMTLDRLRLSQFEIALKTLLDYTLIILSLPLLLPVMGLIAYLIQRDSPGPVFHRRRVLGTGGKTFDALKFRTMVVNGDEVLASRPDLLAELKENQKLKDDPRVTGVGRWLRRTSLDELPQLINVIAGQMSLVGPRMISPEEAEKYGNMQHNLLTVKPGLTGLWQVSGRSDLSYAERVNLDMHYIRSYSIWLDLQILFVQTLPSVLAKRGAY